MFWGVVLVVAGVLLLFNELGWIHGDFWDYVIPILLIALGIKLLFQRRFKANG